MAKSFPNTGATTGLAADRAALTSPFAGMQFFETDTKRLFIYDGSIWNLIQTLNAPIQTFFYGNGSNLTTLNATATLIKPSNVLTNTNSAYNSSTGVFTAPNRGAYLVNANCSVYSSGLDSTYTEFFLNVNGTLYADAWAEIKYIATGTHISMHIHTVVNCSGGETFQFYARSANTTTVYNGTEFSILHISDKI